MRLQIYFGLGMMLGVLSFGFITVKQSDQCLISRQYLVQSAGIILSILTFAFASGLTDYSGYVLYASLYGFFYGGYNYSIKVFVFDKVRARNFNTAWGFLSAVQSLPLFFGIPITGELVKNGYCSRSTSICLVQLSQISHFRFVLVERKFVFRLFAFEHLFNHCLKLHNFDF